MANLQPVSFTSPGYDYGAELSEIQRRQQLAEALRQQSMEPIQQQQGGRYAVPISPWQGLAKIGQGAASGIQAARAQQEQRSLSEKAQGDYRRMLAEGLQQLQGTPTSEDAAGNVTPAQPPNAAAALGTFGGHPMGAAFTPYVMQQMQREQLAKTLSGTPQPMQAPPAYGQPGFDPNAKPVPTGPKGGGPAGGQPMEAWLQSDSTGKSYLEQLAKDYTEQHKPLVDRGYGIKTLNPATGKYDLASSLSDISAVEGAKAGATVPYSVHNVQQAGGGTVPTFGYQLPGFGGLPGNQSQPSTAPSRPPQVPSAQQPALRQSPQAPRLATGDPWATMPRRMEQSGIGETTYTRETSTKAAEYAHKLAEKYGGVAQTANERKSFNDQALAMLPHATTGAGALAITEIQNFLTSRFGIPEATLAKASAGDVTATLELNKNLLNAATKTAKANYGSRMTQSEVMMQIKQGSPNADMTSGAISYLLKADSARADYELKQASDVGKYLSQGGDPYQFEGWYGKTFPMSKAIMGAGKPDLSDATRQFMKKNGIAIPGE